MANLERLLQVLQAGIEEPNLVMNTWKSNSSCGTTHCLFGSYVEKHEPEDFSFELQEWNETYRLKYKDSSFFPFVLESMAEHFDITLKECMFLFTLHHGNAANAEVLDRKEALDRLRKFIIYKFIKQHEVPFFHQIQTITLVFRDERTVNEAISFISDFLGYLKANE